MYDAGNEYILTGVLHAGGSPLSFSGLSPGEHWLRVLPEGCPQRQGQTFRFTV